MKKKLVSILLCAAMVAGLAVGCGGKKEEGGDLYTGLCGVKMSHRRK